MRLRTRILVTCGFVAGGLAALPLAAPAASKKADARAASATTPAAAPMLNPAWSVTPGGSVEWQRVAPLGQLIVKTSTGLSAIDPDRGRILWTHPDLGGLAEDKYAEIPGSSLVTMSDGLQK